jgi:rubrerythrin
MKNEQAEKHFYLEQARRTRNVVARVLFEALAADEDEHKRRLAKLYQKLKSDGSWPESVPLEVAGTDVRQRLFAIARDTAEVAAHDADDMNALRKAESFEAAGSALYQDLSAACANPREASFFGILAGIEREHLLSVRDSISYLEDPGAWLSAKERAGLDGA